MIDGKPYSSSVKGLFYRVTAGRLSNRRGIGGDVVNSSYKRLGVVGKRMVWQREEAFEGANETSLGRFAQPDGRALFLGKIACGLKVDSKQRVREDKFPGDHYDRSELDRGNIPSRHCPNVRVTSRWQTSS